MNVFLRILGCIGLVPKFDCWNSYSDSKFSIVSKPTGFAMLFWVGLVLSGNTGGIYPGLWFTGDTFRSSLNSLLLGEFRIVYFLNLGDSRSRPIWAD